MTTHSSVPENWDPLRIEDIAGVLADAPFRWWVSGGLALELHVGFSWRDHEDTDVGVVRSELARVYEWLRGWEMVVASGGKLADWEGEDLHSGRNNVWVRRPGRIGWEVDFTVGDGSHERWVYRRNPSIVRPWGSAVLATSDGVPYLAPDLQLLFKSKLPRPKDQLDAERVIPLLSAMETDFLRAHLPAHHQWQTLLDGGG